MTKYVVPIVGILMIVLISSRLASPVNAYGSITPTSNVYKIVGIPGTGTQMLPHSYVQSFTKWKLAEKVDDQSCASSRLLVQDEEPPNQQKLTPSGKNEIEIRPTLHFLIKSGVPTYVMSGLQVRSSSSPESKISLLLAQQWTTFGMVVEPSFRMVVYAGLGDGTDERLDLADSEVVRKQVELLGMVLSQQNDEETSDESKHDLTSGFHMISLVLNPKWISMEAKEGSFVSCILTSEPDAREMFTLDSDLLEMTATSMLKIQLSDICHITK